MRDELKVGDQREVIRGEEGGARAVEGQPLQLQRVVVVDVVEMHEGQEPRIRPLPLEVLADIHALQVRAEEMRGEAGRPLVEVPEHDARPGELLVAQDLHVREPSALVAPLDVVRAQVDVEHVHHRPADVDVDVQAAAPLEALHAEVVVLHRLHREAGQDHVAVGGPPQLAVLAQAELEAHLVGDVARLVLVVPGLLPRHHLLEGDDVRLDLAQHVHDAPRARAAIEAAAAVDVVGRDPDPVHGYCCRSSSQPRSSCPRSENGRRRHVW